MDIDFFIREATEGDVLIVLNFYQGESDLGVVCRVIEQVDQALREMPSQRART